MLPLASNQLLMSGFSRGVEHRTKQACAQRCLSFDATDAAALRRVCVFATPARPPVSRCEAGTSSRRVTSNDSVSRACGAQRLLRFTFPTPRCSLENRRFRRRTFAVMGSAF